MIRKILKYPKLKKQNPILENFEKYKNKNKLFFSNNKQEILRHIEILLAQRPCAYTREY